ncbi:hypothetical protein CXF85_02395 [Colwellia sp. 75C3]|uniref:PEP-CTERM sorting domain-containing protein n=1 Tax=Colwellia sp. 75C3 TaxID=888425 RepID=UPI000C3263B8|nr:PEP-CTERM sorting domain-containing protein [Colwellia sp. 75C3]PKG85663.1 hypothetical protein CXF85_02395 [Colwellia sp. 75C3]
MTKFLITILALLSMASLSLNAHATLINFDGTSTVGNDSLLVPYFGSSSTVLSIALNFEVATGQKVNESVGSNSASGEVTWNDGQERIFTIDSYYLGSVSSNGYLSFNFNGLGPDINGKNMTDFILRVNIGENPFTSNLLFSDALIDKSITSRAAIRNGNVASSRTFGESEGNLTVAVPVPASIYLFSLGMIMLSLRKKYNRVAPL